MPLFQKILVCASIPLVAIGIMMGLTSCEKEEIQDDVNIQIPPSAEEILPPEENITDTEVQIPPIVEVEPGEGEDDEKKSDDIVIDVNQREENEEINDEPTLEGDVVITPGAKGVN